MSMDSEEAARLGAAFMDAIEEARSARKAVRRASSSLVVPALTDSECFAAHRKIGLLLYNLVDEQKIASTIAKRTANQP
jgi:hypothetical protein